MTTGEPAQGQPSTGKNSVLGDSALGITGTRGIKTAIIAQERAQQKTINPD
jgi:hypothetical protein